MQLISKKYFKSQNKNYRVLDHQIKWTDHAKQNLKIDESQESMPVHQLKILVEFVLEKEGK